MGRGESARGESSVCVWLDSWLDILDSLDIWLDSKLDSKPLCLVGFNAFVRFKALEGLQVSFNAPPHLR